MAEHTPGPWDTGGDEHNICAERDGRRVIVAMISHDITGDTLSGPSGCDEEHRECHANARLIAAAPELIEALEELEDCASGLEADVDAGRDTERNAQDVRYACKKAREVIAKAKGESRE